MQSRAGAYADATTAAIATHSRAQTDSNAATQCNGSASDGNHSATTNDIECAGNYGTSHERTHRSHRDISAANCCCDKRTGSTAIGTAGALRH